MHREDCKFEDFAKKICYNVPSLPNATIHETLGKVWKRKDERWNWVRHSSCYSWNHWQIGQGVASSLEEAKKKILEGWID